MKTNETVTLENLFQALNWSIRILNDGIFSKHGWESVCRSMARDSKQRTKNSGQNRLQLNTYFEFVALDS